MTRRQAGASVHGTSLRIPKLQAQRALHLESTLVDEAMVSGTKEDQVLHGGRAAVRPVLDVVGVYIEAVGAPGELAVAIS